MLAWKVFSQQKPWNTYSPLARSTARLTLNNVKSAAHKPPINVLLSVCAHALNYCWPLLYFTYQAVAKYWTLLGYDIAPLQASNIRAHADCRASNRAQTYAYVPQSEPDQPESWVSCITYFFYERRLTAVRNHKNFPCKTSSNIIIK